MAYAIGVRVCVGRRAITFDAHSDDDPIRVARGRNQFLTSATRRQRAVAWLTRWYPLASGAGSFGNHRFIAALAGPSSGEIGNARLAGGERLLVGLDDYVGRAAFFAGDLDPKVTWVCRRVLRDGDHAIDVGANHGIITVRLATSVGPRGRVLAFEPNPALAVLLRRSLEVNGFTHVGMHAIALGERDDSLQLAVPRTNSGKATLRGDQSVEGERVSVPVRPLDDMVTELQGPIRLLKLDVEGFEAPVLRGATRLLRERPPQVIVFECNDHRTPIDAQEVPRILLDAGYELFGLPFAWLRPRIDRIDRTRPPPTSGHEFVAIHRSGDFEALTKRLRLPT